VCLCSIEYMWNPQSMIAQEDAWLRNLGTGVATMHDYNLWQATATHSGTDPVNNKKELPHFMLECYPTELPTPDELATSSGIVWYVFKPLFQSAACSFPEPVDTSNRCYALSDKTMMG